MDKISYIQLEDREVITLNKGSLFLENIDYFVSVFSNTCKCTKKKGKVLLEIKCPLYTLCDKKTCGIAEELRMLRYKMER